ncbi:hypothetical protein ACJ72_04470 [Emergomyces africanus]|uniref:HIT-type domain-containing protein n=1 Tax=Emergomyces africanus TaxID=1955775 RepID=A0A1B7NWN5_9EURO|nr:hypothetical protein ACJ72_04470 [Emergomyces africanus]
MAFCEVCSTEPSKYRCPTCNVQSCSLGCTQSHKIHCTPKAPEQGQEPEKQTGLLDDTVQNDMLETAPGDTCEGTSNANPPLLGNLPPNFNTPKAAFHFKDLESPQALNDLFARYPALRSQLREIYKLTLEEEWVETNYSNYGRGRGRGRGRGAFAGRGGGRSRGPWNEEKGFNRGLGKVRRLRESLESNNYGAASSADIEGFRQFSALVLADNDRSRDMMRPQPEVDGSSSAADNEYFRGGKWVFASSSWGSEINHFSPQVKSKRIGHYFILLEAAPLYKDTLLRTYRLATLISTNKQTTGQKIPSCCLCSSAHACSGFECRIAPTGLADACNDNSDSSQNSVQMLLNMPSTLMLVSPGEPGNGLGTSNHSLSAQKPS